MILRNRTDYFALLQDKLDGGVSEFENLAPHTSFGIGGPARFFYAAARLEDLVSACQVAVQVGLRFFILGGGSNVLFSDEGYNGLVIKNNVSECSEIGEIVSAQSGMLLDGLVDYAASHSLEGLEFAAGIPGTVGGAVFGNAGAFGGCMADIIESSVLYDFNNGVEVVNRDYFKFGYRDSLLKKKPALILSSSFKLCYGQKEGIADRIEEYRQLRKEKHPLKEGCAGSIFKNIKEPDLLPAGRLLEEAGVRGLKVGDAEVFEKHCNIIINKGKAKASEVIELAGIMKEKVEAKFNIKLEFELMIVKP